METKNRRKMWTYANVTFYTHSNKSWNDRQWRKKTSVALFGWKHSKEHALFRHETKTRKRAIYLQHCRFGFFWTMLRASLQLWQSLSCAKIVIVRQRDQKERSGIDKNKQTKPKQAPKQKHQTPSNRPVPDQSAKVKQGETSSGSLSLLMGTSCWLRVNCKDMTFFSSRTWAVTAIAGSVQYSTNATQWDHRQCEAHLSYHRQADLTCWWKVALPSQRKGTNMLPHMLRTSYFFRGWWKSYHSTQIVGSQHKQIRPHSGQGVDSCVPITSNRSLGRNTESCNFSALVWNKRCLPLRTVDMRALGVAN